MIPSKGPMIALAASLLVHAAAVAPFSSRRSETSRVEKEAVMISYVIYPKINPRPVVSTPIKEVAVSAPKVRQIQYPRPEIPKPALRKSAELLTDPQSGEIFSGYFEEIKKKIHQTVQKKYARKNPGEGIVSLVFILRMDGSLENVVIVPRESSAIPAVQKFAVECIQESAPFGPFPKELDLQRISFNVTVLFDTVQ